MLAQKDKNICKNGNKLQIGHCLLQPSDNHRSKKQAEYKKYSKSIHITEEREVLQDTLIRKESTKIIPV